MATQNSKTLHDLVSCHIKSLQLTPGYALTLVALSIVFFKNISTYLPCLDTSLRFFIKKTEIIWKFLRLLNKVFFELSLVRKINAKCTDIETHNGLSYAKRYFVCLCVCVCVCGGGGGGGGFFVATVPWKRHTLRYMRFETRYYIWLITHRE